jgi:hypothetical protein
LIDGLLPKILSSGLSPFWERAGIVDFYAIFVDKSSQG